MLLHLSNHQEASIFSNIFYATSGCIGGKQVNVSLWFENKRTVRKYVVFILIAKNKFTRLNCVHLFALSSAAFNHRLGNTVPEAKMFLISWKGLTIKPTMFLQPVTGILMFKLFIIVQANFFIPAKDHQHKMCRLIIGISPIPVYGITGSKIAQDPLAVRRNHS